MSDIRYTAGKDTVTSDHPLRVLLLMKADRREAISACLTEHSYHTMIHDLNTPAGAADCILLDTAYGDNASIDTLTQIRKQFSLQEVPLIILLRQEHRKHLLELFDVGTTCELHEPWDCELLIRKLAIQLSIVRERLELIRKSAEAEQHVRLLKEDILLSQQVQESFLPPRQMRTEHFSLEARLMTGGDLSGDYFDYALLTPRRLAVFLADVSGHGIASALLANRLKAFFDENMDTAHRPRLFLDKLNRDILDLGNHQHIATAILAHINVGESLLTYASAGHRNMYWLADGNRHTALPATGPALGMFKDYEITQTNHCFTPGCNRLLAFTDGFVEFKSIENKWVTEEQLRDEVMLPNAGLPIVEYVTTLLDQSRELTSKSTWDDDTSLMVVDF